MEKQYEIKTPDGKIINGILNGSLDNSLVLIVHGLAGHTNEALHYNAAHFFNKHGFSTFRIGLYSWNEKNRKLHECTLETHGKDIDTAVMFLKSKGARNISAVGHSYGFPSILFSNTDNFEKIVSWDGTCLPLPTSLFKKNQRIQKPVKGRIIDEGYWVIIGEKMAMEESKLDTIELLKKVKAPVQFVSVPKGDGDPKSAKKMFVAANEPKDLVIIKGATHNFTESGKQKELYQETLRWLKEK